MEAETFRPASMGSLWPLAMIFAVAAILVTLFSLLHDPELSLCEDGIKRTLVAPSTYDRIDVQRDRNGYRVNYDAENRFGVPIRGYAECGADGVYHQTFSAQ